MRFLALVLSMLLPAVPALAQSDAEVLEILKTRIDQYRWSVGMVVGIIEPSGRRVISYGHPAKDDPRIVDGNTVFEIGSITKVFTSLLLADSVLRKEVALNDKVEQHLPEGAHIPERGRSITLLDLSTHTSGLPRTPFNLSSEDLDNPYTGYTEELLYKFLETYELKRDVGSRFEYSNLGAGLLGLALQRPTGKTYESLLRDRILEPLKLESTGITVSADMNRRIAKGHGLGLRPMPAPWDMPTLSAAGALRSSANDMLTFLSAFLGYTQSPLSGAMATMIETRRPTGDPRVPEIGLGWLLYRHEDREIIAHAGDTTGFQSFLGFDPKNRIGIIVLSNSSNFRGVIDLGLHLLNPAYSLLRPEPVQISIVPEVFDRYIGAYELQSEPKMVLTFSREESRFFIQANGQEKIELFAESEKDFFVKVTDAQVSFEGDGVILHQNGFDEPGKRLK